MRNKLPWSCLLLAAALACLPAGDAAAEIAFIRGDANADGSISIADAAYLGAYLFASGPVPPCTYAADAKVDGKLDIADEVMILLHAFLHPDSPRIPTIEEVPPPYSEYLGCEQLLVAPPSVDTGAALYLDDAYGGGAEAAVPLRVAGVSGALRAWRCVVRYSPDTLEFVRVDWVRSAEDGPNFARAEADASGALFIAAYYSMIESPAAWITVADGAKIADVVFRPVGTPAGATQLALDQGYGTAELVFGLEEPAVFSAAHGASVIFDAEAPPAPADLAAQVSGGEVHLAWTNTGAADAVIVERDDLVEPSMPGVIATLPGTATSYVDSPPAGPHGYRVRAKLGTKVSTGPFVSAPVWTLPAPDSFAAMPTSPYVAALTWVNKAQYTGLELFRDGIKLADLPADAQSYTDGTRQGPVSVYHLRALSGAGRSARVAAIMSAASGVTGEFGEDGVENLAVVFANPDGDVALSWDPASAAEGYEVILGLDVVATLDASARSYVHRPILGVQSLYYGVRTIAGGEAVAARVGVIRYQPYNGIENLAVMADPDMNQAVITWVNPQSYVGITVSRDGAFAAALPGDATSFVHDFTEQKVVAYTFQPFGAAFFAGKVQIALSDSSMSLLRGDMNWDGRVSIADALFMRRYLFLGGDAPPCFDAADANDDGSLDIADQVSVISMIFMSGPILPEPYPVPGLDLSPDDLTCMGGDIMPGAFTEDLLEIGEVEAAPGRTVTIPVYMSNSVPVEAFQIVVEYDPSLFTPCDGQIWDEDAPCHALDFDGTAYGVLYGNESNPPQFAALSAQAGDGYFVAGAIWNFVNEQPIPPGDHQLLVKINGKVSESAVPGQVIALTPINGTDNEGVGMHRLLNEITWQGESRYVSFYPQTKAGLLRVKDNPVAMDFTRGEVNLDGQIDIADPIRLLGYLFQQGPDLGCPDGADANDDGKLDVGDAILILDYLFGPPGSEEPGLLIGICGQDQTLDGLEPCVQTTCGK